MASTLDGGGKDRNVTRGHGTEALGPSDTSDSGSDVRGGPGLVEGDVIGLDESGTTSDADLGGRTAGPDLGDADLDSDTDSTGTGERRAAGRDRQQPREKDRGADRPQESPQPAAGAGASSDLATGRGAGSTGTGRGAGHDSAAV